MVCDELWNSDENGGSSALTGFRILCTAMHLGKSILGLPGLSRRVRMPSLRWRL